MNVLLLLAASLATLQAQSPQDVEARILAIENEIMPAVVIRGEPVRTATLAARMERHGVPGISIAVINDGKIEWARGYGFADVEEGKAVTANTLFQAASISKPVAATAALKFVQDGRLDLDENVNLKLVSWKVPENEHTAVDPVTLRGLLTHSAGMTVHGFPGYARSADIPTTHGVLDGEGNTDPIRVDIEPGSRWRYSGGGYTVMQQLLMDVLGEPFPQIMRETVLEPFGMSVSTYEQPLPETRWADAATGYRANGDPVEEKWHVYPEMAAAGLWTTPSDLARFAIQIQQAYAGQSNAVLSTQMAREMLTPHANNWGLGPAIQDDGARFSHGGANEGFRCQLTAFIEGGRGAAIMTNSDAGGELANEVLLTIGVVYDWPGFEPIEKIVAQIDPSIYQQVAGRYDFPDLGVIVIEQADGSLWVETPDGDRLELLPESENVFFLRDNGRRVTFVRENGRVMAFIYGRMRAERIE
ncbi:MAG: serine hydrolase domain-containing protein [Gemmatimonadales bacterium]|jgi:CubicO group peptidase (beta-lactamase class C family)